MGFNWLDYIFFSLAAFFICYEVVRALRRKSEEGEYFLAGEKLHWVHIGMSLLAADISLEYMMGMAAEGYRKGLGLGSYEWTASITLIVVALYITPQFMRAGVHTLPEYLGIKYHPIARLTLAAFFLLGYIIGLLAPLIYSSGIAVEELFHIDRNIVIWFAGILGGVIVISGGISLKLRFDLIWVGLIMLAGIIITGFCLYAVGGFNELSIRSENRLNALLPGNDDTLPWTQVFFGSLWIAHFYYWGFNQYMVQTTLLPSTLSQSQFGMLLAASLKLVIPFLIIIPGIVGYELYAEQIKDPDLTLTYIIDHLIPPGVKGFIIVAYVGTVFTCLNAVLLASSTLFTKDVYEPFIKPGASERRLVTVSRICIVMILVFACLLATNTNKEGLLFQYSINYSNAISPGIVAVFLFSFFSTKTRSFVPVTALFLSILAYLLIQFYFAEQLKLLMLKLFIPDSTILTFVTILLYMFVCRLLFPLAESKIVPDKKNVRFERNLVVIIWSVFIFTLVAAIYVVFGV